MEIGPNLCVWSIQSGIDHELNSMKNLSPIVQQKNSFAYNRSNGVVLELESDSETEVESTPKHHPSLAHHHIPIGDEHQEKLCQSQWDARLINLSTNANNNNSNDGGDDKEGREVQDHFIDHTNVYDSHVHINTGYNILSNHNTINNVAQHSIHEKQSSMDNIDFQNLHYFHDKTNSNNKDYTCGFCGFDFDTAEQVEEHVLFKHSDNLITSNDSKIKPMNSSLPSDSFPSTVLTTTDTTTKTNSTTDTVTKNLKSPTNNDLELNNFVTLQEDSVNSLRNDHELSIDPSENSSPTNIVAEKSKLIGNDQDFPPLTTINPLITACPLCDRTFVGRRSLNIHLNKTHSIKENSNNNSSGTDNNNSVTNNTGGKQLKSNCSKKSTRPTYSRSLRSLNGNNNNNNDSSNKTTNEIIKSTDEKFLSKISVRPPILPKPSRMNSSTISSSLSKTNIDNKNLQNDETFSQDILVSKNNEVEDLNLQKSRRTVYAVSPSLSTEQSGLKLRIISLDAVKKSTSSHSTLHNAKNNHLSKTHLISDTKSTSTTCFSPTLSPASSSSSLSASSKSALTTRITSEKPNRLEKNKSEFYSPNPSSLSGAHSIHSNSKNDNSQLSDVFLSSTSSLQRSISYPLDSNIAYNFTNNNEASLQLDVKSSSPTDLSTKKSETMDTSLRTSDGLYKCRICKRLFANRYSLTGHYKSHYEPSQKPYCCDDCGQRYTSPSNLHYHRGRNCPVLKLKAIQEGKLIPSSVQNTKLLELKALRAVERKALMNKLKDENDTTATEINNNVGESKSQQPPANKKSRLATCKLNNNVKSNNGTTLKTNSSIESSRENIMSIDSNSTFDTISPRPSINNNVNNNTNNSNVNNISNIFQEDGNGLQIQEIVRLFLMHAYQSDELRQQLLSLTSNALLNTLLPTGGFNSSLFSQNQVPTSNQQLFSLLLNFINSNLSTERNFNNNHDNSSILYKQSKSIMEKFVMQSDSTSLSTEQPTDLTSSCNFSHHNDKSSSPSIHCPICRQDSIKFSDIQELDKHVNSVHERHPRFLTDTTRATAISVQPLVRRHSLDETVPSNTDWNMKSANSMPSTPNTMMQHHQQQPINYSEDLSINNHKLSNTTEQSSQSIISQLNLQPSNLVSCTDCDREFSTYTAFRVHHTKTHQHTANRQHNHINQRHSHSQRNFPKSQLTNHRLSTLSTD
ncbi:hypothetical protein MN116_006835 [Schistosoma mekongi]|uniref:C2H2-type domain-containing protein n=1 Tax=Schistosoma mekongi TaxID=38744 RepID=A0AAE1Z7X3_SCHME|nr:hypothetical protein MN116_006835 [Schistosoma mekongi]